MARIWIITPYDSEYADLFDIAWAYDLEHNTIAVGWSEMGDISHLSREDLENVYKKTYSDRKTKAVITKDLNALWTFYHEIHEGDVIVARRGRKRILAIGKVVGSPFYDETKGRERLGGKAVDYYTNFMPVAWDNKNIDFDRQVFSFYTIYEISEEKLKSLLVYETEKVIQDFEEPELAASETEFILEKYLEDFIVSNFGIIFKGKLELYTEPDGSPAQQYPVLNREGKISGRIDILAIDKITGDFVVIELKKGKESDPVVGQTLRYMGWVKENMCESTQSVKGLIICKEVDERLDYAIKAVSDRINIKKYKVDFQLLET